MHARHPNPKKEKDAKPSSTRFHLPLEPSRTFRLSRSDELLTLLDVLWEFSKSSVEELLLLGRELSERVDLLDTLSDKLDVGG